MTMTCRETRTEPQEAKLATTREDNEIERRGHTRESIAVVNQSFGE